MRNAWTWDGVTHSTDFFEGLWGLERTLIRCARPLLPHQAEGGGGRSGEGVRSPFLPTPPPPPPPPLPPKMPGNSLGARTCRLGGPQSTWPWLCKLLNPLYVSGFIIWKVGVMVGLSSWWLWGLNEVRNATSSRGAWCAVCVSQGFALLTRVPRRPLKKGCWWLM